METGRLRMDEGVFWARKVAGGAGLTFWVGMTGLRGMEINLGTPALLFPAISLLMLAYTNRFLGLAAVVRQVHQLYEKTGEAVYIRQIESLRKRVKLTRDMQFCGAVSLLLCTVCMFVLFWGWVLAGQVVFGVSLVFMVASLVVSLWEIWLSVHALDMHLEDMGKGKGDGR